MKENDYILASMLNPGFSNQDFKDILGMNMENTQLLPYSSYTSSPFITQNEQFQDDRGNFNEAKFKDFYTDSIGKFSTFNVDQPLVENFEYSIFDTSRKADSRVKDPNFKLTVVSNPTGETIGISGVNQVSKSPFSDRERAQRSKIYDSKKGEWLDYSPNDMSLVRSPLKWFKSLFDDPLVMATWNEEGDHKDPITKQIVHHQKGDYRLNNEGQYFYETLGDQSPVGKDILTSLDILTVDGEGINKYDFMDTDGLDKSVTGTIAKTALTVAPLFIGGPVANIYGASLVAREMGKSLPMLYGMISSLWGNEEDSKLLNTIAAYGDKFTSGTSDYSRQNTVTFENVASLIGDVATQYGQQKTIAGSINKLRGSDKILKEAQQKAAAYYSLQAKAIQKGAISSAIKGDMKGMTPLQYIGNPEKWTESALGKAAIEKFVKPVEKLVKSNSRLGADASLVYMAIISNTDVYQSMLDHGASKRDAAAVAFGSTLGMFAVDRYLGLGELFFDELRNDARIAFRNAVKKESKAVAESLVGTGAEAIANPAAKQTALRKYIQKGINLGKNVAGKFADDVKNHTTGFFGKALGEGFEEVSEELVADLSKYIYQIAGDFSPNFINRSGIKDVGAWENMSERYLMSFFGGALGGGLFYGVNAFQGGSFSRDTSKDELIYLVANKRTPELIKELDKWKAAGKFGSKTLSASKWELDAEGNRVYLTAENEDDSQNTFIYNRIKDSIFQLEHMLNYTKTNLSEDDLFKQMVLREQRLINLKDYLQDQAYTTKYQENFRNLTKELLASENELSLAYKSEDGTASGKPLPDSPSSQALNDPKRLQNIKELEEKVNDLRKQRDSFISGEQSLPYLDKLLFSIDPYLRNNFLSMTYDEWLRANKGKTVDQLSPAEKESFKQEYLTYKEHRQPLDLNQAYDLYKQIGNLINPHIASLSENANKFQKNHEILQKFFIEGNPFEEFHELDDNVQQEWETEEEFKNKDTQLEGESDEDFNKRVNDRKKRILDHNNEQMRILTEKVQKIISDAGGYIDPSTLRHLTNRFRTRKSDIANDIIQALIKTRQEKSQGAEMKMYEVMKKIRPDFSNLDEVRKELEEMILTPERLNLKRADNNNKPVREGLEEMFRDFGYNYDPNNLTGFTVLDFMYNLADRIIANDSSLVNIFNKIDRGEFLEDLRGKDRDTIVDELMSYDLGEESLLEAYLGDNTDNGGGRVGIETEEWAPIRAGITEQQENYRLSALSNDEIEARAREMSQSTLDWAYNTLQQLKDNVDVNPFVQLMTTLESSVSDINPVTQLLKQIHVAIDPENRSIEAILDALHAQSLGLSSKSEFILKAQDEQTLDDVVNLLHMAQAYLYAASAGFDYNFPVGHNGVINEFVQNHKDVIKDFEELPTLDNSVANMYILEIQKYLNELDPEISTSWRALSSRNRANKRQRLVTTEANYNKAKLQLFDVLLKATSKPTKFTVGDKDKDLLEGASSITDDDDAIRLHKLENLFYINLHKALAEGITFKEILQQTHLLEALSTNGNLNEILEQTTSDLDEHINYGKLTDFDKFIYILTISGISSNEFNNFIKSGIESEQKEKDETKRTVPLTVQEQTSRLAIAHIKSRNLFLQAFDYLKGELKKELRPFLENIIFIDGSAGVGKTTVIAKNTAKYINSDKIWLSAPKQTQLDTLQRVIGKGETKLREDLFKLILDPSTYETIQKQLESSEANKSLITVKKLDDRKDGNTAEVVNNLDQMKFNTPKDMPQLIIIDEITHFSSIELQILNEFAKRNNISIIGLGDSIQNGFTGVSRNIEKEKLITFRSSRLSVTLRDENLQKQDNLITVANIITAMSKLDRDKDPNFNQKFLELIKLARKIKFNVYDQEVINGDLITKTLTPEQVKKLYGTVAFVGDTTTSEAYKTLTENYDPNKIQVLKPTEIQGQEFDFVIVDQKWEDKGTFTTQWMDFLANLYTMMSRGRVGSIFIDNNLSNIIGSNTVSTNKEDAPNLREALQPFIDSKLESLNKLGLISNEDFDKLINPKKEPKAKSGTSSKEKANNEGTDEGTGNNEGTSEGTSEGTNNPGEDTEGDEEGDSELLPTDESLIDKNPYKSDEQAKQETETIYTALGDKTDERINQSEENMQIDPEFPIRFYGSAHFSGLRKEVVKDKSGSKAKTTYWHNPHSEVKEDLQIFMNGDTVVDNEITPLVKALLNLKSVILYGDDPNTLHSSVTSVVDAEHLKDIKFKLEVRPRRETDNFVGLTGLQEEGPEGNRPDFNNGLVYVLVGEFKNNNEEQCKITLGLIANPDSYFVSDKFKNTSKEAQINTKIERYRKVFNGITELYNKEVEKATTEEEKKKVVFSQEVFPHFSGVTNIRRYTGVGNERKPVEIQDLAQFRKTHPHSVISDPYVFIGSNFRGYDNIDALRGRAVVFVSDDTTLNEEDLMSIYISQKEATNDQPDTDMFHLEVTKPRVRMLILQPKGVSFKSLLFSKTKYTTEQTVNGDTLIKTLPFEEEYMGARMYASLWNYRANLTRFLDEYKTWKGKTGYTDEQVLKIARYIDAVYKRAHDDESEFDEEIDTIINSEAVTQKEIDDLNAFNDSLASSVRQFRIGGSRQQSGVYLRKLTAISSDNPYYQDVEGTPIGIYITPKVAAQHLKLINAILNDALGPYIKLQERVTDEEGNTKVTAWPIDRLVSPKQSQRESGYNTNPRGFRNSLSGLVSELFSANTITVEEDGKEYTLGIPDGSKKSFVIVPVALQRLYQQARRFQEDPGDIESTKIRIGDKQHRKYIQSSKLLSLLKVSNGDDFDSSLDDLFALAFHGTTANPSREGLRATDAYFKHGLFVDPMGAEVVGTTSKGQALFKRLLTDESLFTVDVDIDMPIFTVTLADLERAQVDSQTPQPMQIDIIPEDIKQQWSSPLITPVEVLDEVQDLFKTSKSVEEFKQKAAEIINNFHKTRISQSLRNNLEPKDILQSVWEIDPKTGASTTIIEHLESLTGEGLSQAKSTLENEVITLSLPDGKTFIEISFNKVSKSFETNKIIANVVPTDTPAEDLRITQMKAARDGIIAYFNDPKHAQDIEDFRSQGEECENIYEELTSRLDFYTKVDLTKNTNPLDFLSDTLVGFLMDTVMYDNLNVLNDISQIVEAAKNIKECN